MLDADPSGLLAEVALDYSPEDDLLAAVQRRLAWRLARSGKTCSACHQTKPLGDFGPQADTPDGLRSACRKCVSERARVARSRPSL